MLPLYHKRDVWKIINKLDNQAERALSYVLFSNKDVSNETRSFSPIKLLYSWPVREPLDILKDEWQSWENNQTSVLAYVEGAREKLKWMQKQARAVEHSLKKKEWRSAWYDS